MNLRRHSRWVYDGSRSTYSFIRHNRLVYVLVTQDETCTLARMAMDQVLPH